MRDVHYSVYVDGCAHQCSVRELSESEDCGEWLQVQTLLVRLQLATSRHLVPLMLIKVKVRT
jgi:hypothetical protein